MNIELQPGRTLMKTARLTFRIRDGWDSRCILNKYNNNPEDSVGSN
jgi:hypothetical protein